ncbi:hypothetical protein [Flavobacterium sp. SM2513]|uniref:hypothetical protein n=1 Tax=Flavobacterium sp. SM2513 TaxID=3424766 RepID=UPI003D7F6252
MAVIIMGSLGAFGTMSMGAKTNAPNDKEGYRYVDAAHPCVEDIMCTTIVGDVCTTSSFQTLWGKEDSDDAECPVVLYKKL